MAASFFLGSTYEVRIPKCQIYISQLFFLYFCTEGSGLTAKLKIAVIKQSKLISIFGNSPAQFFFSKKKRKKKKKMSMEHCALCMGDIKLLNTKNFPQPYKSSMRIHKLSKGSAKYVYLAC